MRTHIALLSLTLTLAHAAQAAEPMEIDGFSWAENLTFDGRGNLFVSDSVRGEIWRIRATMGGYESTLFLDGFESVGGLVATQDGAFVFATISRFDGRDKVFEIISFQGNEPGVWSPLARLPKLLNGLTLDREGALYATTEGSFIPGNGEVYRVDSVSGQWWSIMSGLWAPDGIAIDPSGELLYVGEVVSGEVWVYDLRFEEVQGSFQGLNGLRFSWLDDFAFGDGDPSQFYGADFARGNVVSIPVDTDLHGPPEVIARGFRAPTSVDFGRGPGFSETSLYVTEGGGFSDTVTDRRVVEIPNVR